MFRYAKKALNYELVMTAARHYWNTALPLVNSKLERELLQESLSTILKCINDTVDREKERLVSIEKPGFGSAVSNNKMLRYV